MFAVSGSAFGAGAQGSPSGQTTARGRSPAPTLVRAEGSGQIFGPNDLGIAVVPRLSRAKHALLFSRRGAPVRAAPAEGGG